MRRGIVLPLALVGLTCHATPVPITVVEEGPVIRYDDTHITIPEELDGAFQVCVELEYTIPCLDLSQLRKQYKAIERVEPE